MSSLTDKDFITTAIHKEILARANEASIKIMQEATNKLTAELKSSMDSVALQVLRRYNILENSENIIITVNKKDLS